MPAPRLPWFKIWIGSTGHAKARSLSDGEFRTWVELIDLSAQQKWRGRFANRKDALALSRRPAAHLSVLILVGLVDEDATDKHLTMHDWDDWQRWRKEDPNDSGTTTESPPEQPTNDPLIDPRTTTERPPDEHSINTRPLRVDVRRKTLRRETLRDDVAAAVAASPDFARARETNGGGSGHVHDFTLRRTRPPPEDPDLPEEVRERLRRRPISDSNELTKTRKERPDVES